jgi:hypothetical protein
MIACVREFLEKARKEEKNIKTVFYFVQKGGDKEIQSTIIRSVDNTNLRWNMKEFLKKDLVEFGEDRLQFEWEELGTGAFYCFTNEDTGIPE